MTSIVIRINNLPICLSHSTRTLLARSSDRHLQPLHTRFDFLLASIPIPTVFLRHQIDDPRDNCSGSRIVEYCQGYSPSQHIRGAFSKFVPGRIHHFRLYIGMIRVKPGFQAPIRKPGHTHGTISKRMKEMMGYVSIQPVILSQYLINLRAEMLSTMQGKFARPACANRLQIVRNDRLVHGLLCHLSIGSPFATGNGQQA